MNPVGITRNYPAQAGFFILKEPLKLASKRVLKNKKYQSKADVFLFRAPLKESRAKRSNPAFFIFRASVNGSLAQQVILYARRAEPQLLLTIRRLVRKILPLQGYSERIFFSPCISTLYTQLLSPLLTDEATRAVTAVPETFENISSANPSEQ